MNSTSLELPWTGERYVPQIRGSIALEHLHRYAFASEYVKNKRVLDIASGEGYGSEMLSRTALSVIGVDIDEESVKHAQKKYIKENLSFKHGSCTDIPLLDHSIDIVVSFETIEHIEDHEKMLSEIKRVLTPEGVLIISSPEKHEYTEVPKYHNPFHVKELNKEEFKGLIEKFFTHHHILGQRVLYGSGILSIEPGCTFSGSYDFKDLPGSIVKHPQLPQPLYLLAICADEKLNKLDSTFCEQEFYESDFCKELVERLADKDTKLARKDVQINIYEDEIARKNTENTHQKERIAKQTTKIVDQERRIAEQTTKIVDQERRIVEQSTELAKKEAQLAGKVTGIIKKAFRVRVMAYEIAKSGLFDEEWYLQQNPDVCATTIHPIFHYVSYGYLERRDPNPLFKGKWYLDENPDVKKAGANPFYHYIKFGQYEGRRPSEGNNDIVAVEGGEVFLKKYLRTYLKKKTAALGRIFFLSKTIKEHLQRKYREDVQFSKLKDHNQGTTHLSDVRAIAIYLPQFHEIKENNKWWGKGFTEWTNVKRGKPFYKEHYQPHIPHPDIGYYNLDDALVLEKQAQLAKEHGIHGFCYYYYWFNGKRLLEKPLDRLLKTGKPDFPFCFCWANENWTRTWDGGENEILIEQNHSYENDEKFIIDLIPALKDSRYIRVNNKPLIIIYRPALLPNMKATAEHWRDVCRKAGIGEIYLACMRSLEFLNPLENGLDAAIQFPPANVPAMNLASSKKGRGRAFSGRIYDMQEAFAYYSQEEAPFPLIRSVCPSWDNTARRMERATSWLNTTPSHYYKWLCQAVAKTNKSFKKGERFIFINAWNEWGEGCHLEPDEKYGYAWLNATKKALKEGGPHSTSDPYILVISHDAARAGAQLLLLNQLREWKKSGAVNARVICVRGGELYSAFSHAFPTIALEDVKQQSKIGHALDDFVERVPDLIYSNTVVNGALLVELKRKYNSPIITHVHELQKAIERWAPGDVMRSTVASTDHFIAVSKEVKGNLKRKHHIKNNNITEIHPGIATNDTAVNESSRLREELGIQKNAFVCFGCGTTDWRKGVDLFINTAQEVIKNIPSAQFVWIGAKVFEKDYDIEDAIREKGLQNNINFIGVKTDPKEYFAIGDVFYLSSREDPFPLVALEAADVKLPIVCFKEAGGMPEFVGADAGIIVPYEDKEAAAAAIITLALDSEKKKNLGKNAQAKVRQYHDIGHSAKQVADLIKAKIRQHKKKAPLVSVIVPNYNHEVYLMERLESIASQTYNNFEIIVLDDASTDKSAQIIQEFLAKEPRARVLFNKVNSGSPFKQWRKGIEMASGKYIWIAESDDSADPQFLEELVLPLEKNESLSIATCQLLMMDNKGTFRGAPSEWLSEFNSNRWKSDYTNNGIEEIRDFLSKKNTILNASGVLIRNFEGLTDLVDDKMRFCADWLLWVRLLSRGGISYSSKLLNYWRIDSGNARNSDKGVLELAEGPVVIRAIGQILKWESNELEAALKSQEERYGTKNK